MEIIESDRDKTTGLTNYNNSCYINSIFQCLAHSSYFLEYILSTEFDEDFNHNYKHSSLVEEIRKTLAMMWVENETIDTNNLCTMINIAIMQNTNLGLHVGQHNDAHEFLNMILTILHESQTFVPNINIKIKNNNISAFDKIALQACKTWKNYFKNGYSNIIDIFYGQYISELKKNDEITHCFDPFQIMDLEIPKKGDNISIEDCIDLHFKVEKLDDSIKKKFYIWKAPKVLIISLKRFDNQLHKDNTRIVYDKVLDLSKYSKGYKRSNIVYNLCGICCHQGDINYGHYTSLCRKNDSRNWFRYDDNNLNQMTNNDTIPLTSYAYILFYELNSL